LNVNKIKNNLQEIAEKVFLLENKKISLNLMVQKQMNEIEQIHKINSTELKNKQTVLHRTKMELTKCLQKINTLKAKYSTLSHASNSNDCLDGDDNNKSQVYIMIKMAQTKQELIDKGNMLDAEIRKSEKELKLLYKSLKHLNHGNTLYRQSLHSKSSTSSNEQKTENHELEEMKIALTNKYRKVTNSLYKHKETLKQLQNSIDSNQHRISLLDQQSQTLQNHISKYSENDNKLNKKLKQQKEKMKRALNEINKVQNAGDTDIDSNKQIKLKELKRRQKSMTEMVRYLDETLQANNIHIPALTEIAAKNDKNKSSTSSTSTTSIASTTRPSTAASNAPSVASVASAVSIVSLSPNF